VVRVGLTDAGREVVEAVTAQRRGEVARVLDTMPVEDAAAVVAALRAFSDAAGELPESDWAGAPG
jgi:DNA-binding MarR family transcriptional regulator